MSDSNGNNRVVEAEIEVVGVCESNSCFYNDNKNIPIPQKKPSFLKPKTQPVKTAYQYKFQKSRTDKRVSLNVTPLTENISPFADRVKYVLGNQQGRLKSGQTVQGFLYNCLSKSDGLIFPYTPQIQISHTVNYETTEIIHSNLAVHHYKNTPPPSISIDATFTADNRENALHMLSALWFLRAVTKCDFGEQANTQQYGGIKGTAGMPPPILYLNGYNSIMDNIPVLVKSFSYSLPKDKDYVALGINLDSVSSFAFNERTLYSSVDGTFFDNYDGTGQDTSGSTYLSGIKTALKQIQSKPTQMTSNKFNSCYFNNWLPTELNFHIELIIQPNLLKYKKKFNLDNYKMGILNLEGLNGGSEVYAPSNLIENELLKCNNPSVIVKLNGEEVIEIKDDDARNIISEAINSNDIKLKTQSFSYTFDKSGWTW